MKPTKIRIQTVTCNNCGDEIYSRAQHDFHYCSCGDINVDGGFDYLKYGWGKNGKPKVRTRYIYSNHVELYNDWNFGKNKYGTFAIKGA